MSIKTLAYEMNINPQTRITFGQGAWAFVVTEASRKAQTFMRYQENVSFWSAVYDAANGINYALTGRVQSVTALAIREMSAYRVLKLVAAMVADGVKIVDAPAWLDARAHKEGWK